ncbi:MAG: DNA polymerase II [Halobacteriovoraceae bacterium]|nr:DNA polymerase II [Halobacteriovoraceae bacterium]
MEIQKGFILTGNWEDNDQQHIIKFYGVGEKGPFEILINNFLPLFFVERNAAFPDGMPAFKRNPLKLKNFGGQDVDALYFKTQKDLFKAKDALSQAGIRTYEADVRSTERYLMERFIFGQVEVTGKGENIDGLWVFKNPEIKSAKYNPRFKVLSLDIETGMKGELYSIAVHQKSASEDIKKVFMVGEKNENRPEHHLSLLDSEELVLRSFLSFFHKIDPDIIIGWHVIGFDLSFLENKCRKYKIPFNLGRGHSKLIIQEKKGAGYFAKMDGRIIVDGPPTMRGAGFQFENFKLDTVAHELLGEGKDISSENSADKVGEIERRFREDKNALALYNLLDCTLVLDIFEKTKLIELVQNQSILSGLMLDRIGVSTAAFDFFMLPKIHRKGFVASNILDINRESPNQGGTVLQPQAGLHEHVLVFDFKSLYPSIMRTFKIDPLSRLLAKEDPIKTPAGIAFSSSNHVLPKRLEELMNRREEAKLEGDEPLSKAIKILMNSFYGVMGSTNSRFYHADLPQAISGIGRWVLEEAITFIKTQGYEVIYGDTDSVFVSLNAGLWGNINQLGNQLVEKTNTHLMKKIKREFKVDSLLDLQFEKYYRKFYLPKARNGGGEGAKKRYAGLLMKDGKEEINFVGMEYVRSDWTKLARNFQFELFQRFFNDENVEQWVKSFVDQVKNHQYDSDLVYKKRLTKRPEEYTSNIPPHVKAALQINESKRKNLKSVEYVITSRGPVPLVNDHSDLDYEHYIQRQVKPLAEDILAISGSNFDDLMGGDQLALF